MSGAANLRLAFVIEAIDNATAKVRAVNAEIEKQAAPMRRARQAAGELLKEAGWTKLQGQIEKVRERASALVGTVASIGRGFALASAAAGGGFFFLTRSIDSIDHANDVALKLHLPVEQFQRMAYAAQLNGGSQEELADALKKLSLSQVEAINGSKEQVLWFQRAGITIEQLKRMDVAQVWEAIGDTFNRVGDAGLNAQKKLALLQALTGRSSDSLVQMLNLGRKGMREFYAEADRLGVVIDGKTAAAMADFNDNMDRLRFSIFGVTARIAKYALPALDAMINRFIDLNSSRGEEWAKRIGTMIGNLITRLPAFLTSLGQIGEALGRMAIAADNVAQALGGWDVVIKGLAALLATKLLIDFGLFVAAVAQAVPTLIALGKVLFGIAAGLTSVLSLPVLVAGVFIAAALAIWAYWEPLKEYLSSVWEVVKEIAAKPLEIIGKMTAGAPITYNPAPGAPSIYAGDAAWAQYRAQQQAARVDGTVRVELGDGLKPGTVRQRDGGIGIDVHRGPSLSTP